MDNKQQASEYMVNKPRFNKLKRDEINKYKFMTVTSKSYDGRNTVYYFAFPHKSMSIHAMENHIREMMRQYDDIEEFLVDYGRNA